MADTLPKVEQEKAIRGDSRTWTDTFYDDDTGELLDMSDWGDWLCQIRGDLDRGTLIATVDVDDSGKAQGRIVRSLTSDQADLLPPPTTSGTTVTNQKVYMDLQATRTSDGFRQTWKRWKLTVEGDVSDD